MKILDRLRHWTRLPENQDSPSQVRTRAMPGIVWIELTSRCPFDCVFCSRKLLRGKGQHMDFELLKKLIRELGQPEVIRLNYSGESSHYPHVVEACELAAGTGAQVELVTALASLPWHRVDGLAKAGLSRLTISLHTLDETRFQEIYRFSDVHEMKARIERIVELSKSAPHHMAVDFAFVAMQRNLRDLGAVADYASAIGVSRVDIHPVIRRDPIPETFDDELDGDRLKPSFLADLRATLGGEEHRHPEISFRVSTPELMERTPLREDACTYPWPLLSDARIHGCEQDPWNTVHILAGGEVVTCEVRDQIVMGRLTQHSLSEIWNSPSYVSFRADYFHARDTRCRNCSYKVVSAPAPLPGAVIAPATGRSGLVYGWHSPDLESIFWSSQRAKIALLGRGLVQLKFSGLLPPGEGSANVLTLKANGVALKTWTNESGEMVDVQFEKRVHAQGQVILELETSQMYCPLRRGTGDDSRDLGFALIEASLTAIAQTQTSAIP